MTFSLQIVQLFNQNSKINLLSLPLFNETFRFSSANSTGEILFIFIFLITLAVCTFVIVILNFFFLLILHSSSGRVCQTRCGVLGVVCSQPAAWLDQLGKWGSEVSAHWLFHCFAEWKLTGSCSLILEFHSFLAASRTCFSYG